MHGILNNVDLRCHSLSERSESRRDKLKLDFKELFLDDSGNVDLNLEVEHVVGSHALGDLEKVFLAPAIKIIDQEATRIPVVFCSVEDLELDEGRLACLHCRVVLAFRTVLLLWHMLNVR